MVDQWEPGTYYELGCVVEFQDHRYKIIQPHRSQSDWIPPRTPALWGRLSETAPEYGHKQQQDSYKEHTSDAESKPWHDEHSQKVDIPHEEQKKHWYDIDDHRKKQLEIGGGLAAGLAVLGAGYYAYHEHHKTEEEKKAQVWGLQGWLRDAQNRAAAYHENGFQGNSVIWVLTHGRNIPQGAIPGGRENGNIFYIARAFHEGGIQVGKAGTHLQEGANVGYKHKETQLGTYEVLVGEERAIKWVNAHGHLKPDELGCTLVEGGRENDGTTLFVAQADINGSVHPGKCSTKLDGAFIPYGGSEERVKEFRVLAYA